MPSRQAKSRTIQVNYLTRAEGEAALRIHTRDGELIDLRLTIFEPPRFFESFLRDATRVKRRTSPRASAASVQSHIR
jgi:hypothetical protein